MKIDIFPHIFPVPFFERMAKVAGKAENMVKRTSEIPVLTDLNERFRIMDRYPDYVQILTLASPPIETLADPKNSPELARIANDGMAEICAKHPDRFPTFAASVCMNNMDACLEEIDRAINKLGAKGIQIFSNVAGRPLDEPEFRPLFAKMAQLDLPIWLHPARPSTMPDYPVEKKSRYEIWWTFGWPYETSAAMARIVFSGMFDQFPDIKIITHHCGAMIPTFEGRTGFGMDQLGARTPDDETDLIKHSLKRRIGDYFRMFYGDTALFGALAPLQAGVAYFGCDRILFGTDMPFDPEKGNGFIRETIRCVDNLQIAPAERQKIYEDNARRLLKLPKK